MLPFPAYYLSVAKPRFTTPFQRKEDYMTNTQPARHVLMAVEKPMVARLYIPIWNEIFPNDKVSVYYIPPMGALSFDIPRNLPLSSVPQIAPPKWKVGHWAKGFKNPTAVPDFNIAAQQADLIVCATDRDRAGVFNFENLIKYYGIKTTNKIQWVAPIGSHKEVIEQAIKDNIKIDHPDFDILKKYNEARRYFDYNYTINALPCIGATLKAAGAKPSVNYISKNGLLLIQIILKSNSSALCEGCIVELMREWQGTGKYSIKGIGSLISRSQIIEDLVTAGLLEVPKNGKKSPFAYDINGRLPQYQPSDLAHRFVALLHKSAYDPDLTGRLDEWAKSWPESKPTMERYIKTVFGKQKRYLERNMAK